ncbi:tetratricopeptide repeat protein [Niveispirillum sp.]|uniref:tetratricopeptide repeat protein n=1 Tax=Niveispirillum sp. TaxID=1917217 RepID=UPI001B5EC16B|nr:tetratricopeptide repeat protein [Niveispirillum sp.]MBP7340047.1 tetratricopeptide repeat protein [Niveispirillum sp.]
MSRSAEQLMADGMALQSEGRIAEAEAAFRHILDLRPEDPDALHALGAMVLLAGDAEGAVPLLARSLRRRHANAPAFSNLCAALRQLGRLEQAAIAGREAVLIDPDFDLAQHNLASVLLDQKDYEGALVPLRRYITLVPDCTLQRFLLATALMAQDRYAEAEPVWRELLCLTPGEGRAHANLGVVLKQLRRYGEAIDAYRRALVLMPDEAAVLNNLGLALSQTGERDEEAAAWLHRAVRLKPDFADAWVNLALLERNRNRIDAALVLCRRALAEDGGHAEAHTLLGTCLLLKGEMRAGFAAYEWRKKLREFRAPPHAYPSPSWTGGDPAARTLLLHDEQGLGDGIQFARYAPLLAARGARVAVECAAPLLRLFATLPGVDSVVATGQPLPTHDAHVPLLSLPHLLGETAVPAFAPYLSAEPALAECWAARLAGDDGLKVGLVWAGNPEFKDDRRRSPGLAALLPLLSVPGVRFFALQKGGGRADLDRLAGRLGARFTDLGPEIADFADTAAIMTNLDLIISSCTAPAHLAGALGRPVWTILPLNADWRWRESGHQTDWYPSMTLFRQERAGDWAPVVARVRDALVGRAAESCRVWKRADR